MPERCEHYTEAGICKVRGEPVTHSEPCRKKPELCREYWRGRAERAEKRVAELETNWHDVSEENFRALWEAYAMAADETLTADAIRLKHRLRAIVTAPAPAQEGEA